MPLETAGAEKLYLLFLGSTSPMQSYVPAVRARVSYGRGPAAETVFSNPESFDFYMEHASRHFGQPLTSEVRPWVYRYYQRQFHADIAEILLDRSRKARCLELAVVGLDTTMALLGVTLLK